MTSSYTELDRTRGFLVVDAHGRRVGTVECPMYGRSAIVPDALAVRFGWFAQHRRLVPAGAIESVDAQARMVDLRVDLESVVKFL